MYKRQLLAREVGFDGVDIKSCHRYLLSELLASHTRGGKYGGSFENRTRFLRQTIRAVREAVGDDFIVACRFNVFEMCIRDRKNRESIFSPQICPSLRPALRWPGQ